MILRHLMMTIATTIVLLHSIIPHSHHSELTHEEHHRQHENASSILDFISLAFHLDHEDGQLEEFVQGNDIDIDQLFPVSTFTATIQLEIVVWPQDLILYNSLDVIYTDRSILSSKGLRAPPSLS